MIRSLIGLSVALVLGGCATGAGFDPNTLSGMNRTNEPSHFGAYLAGRQAQLDRDTEAAALHYRRALATGPLDPDLVERAYVLEISNGHVGAARRLAEVAAALEPQNSFAKLTVAVDQFDRGQYSDASATLDGLEAGPLTRITVALVQAWAQVGLRDSDAAIEVLATLDGIQGIEMFQSYHSALIEDLAGNPGRAEIGYVAAITASGGSSVRAVEAYGNFLERSDRSEQAVRIYDAYLDLAPNSPVVIAARARAMDGGRAPRLVANAKAGAAEALFSVAAVIATERSYDVPALYLQFVLHLRPRHNSARMLLAGLYNRMGLSDRATAEFAAIERNSPLKQEAEIQRAMVLDQNDQHDAAIEILLGLSSDDPHSFEAWVGLADILRGESRFEEAADAYAHAIELLTDDAPRFWALYYAYGIALERIGEWEEAEASFFHALELAEDHPYVLNYLGYSWIEQGVHLEQALDMIHRAVEQRPEDGFIVDSLGWGYYQLGQYEEAVIHLERAAELAAGDPTINDHLGDAYWRIGMERQARFQWGHALLLELDDETRANVVDKIANGMNDQPQTAMENGVHNDGEE